MSLKCAQKPKWVELHELLVEFLHFYINFAVWRKQYWHQLLKLCLILYYIMWPALQITSLCVNILHLRVLKHAVGSTFIFLFYSSMSTLIENNSILIIVYQSLPLCFHIFSWVYRSPPVHPQRWNLWVAEIGGAALWTWIFYRLINDWELLTVSKLLCLNKIIVEWDD